MSRTYRQPPHWANAQLASLLEEIPTTPYLKSHLKWLKVTIARCRGQDGTYVTPAHDPSNGSPKGYGWWGSDGMNGKRFSKRRTAKIMRRRGTKEARAQLHELWNDHQLNMEIELQEENDRAYEAWLLMDYDDDVHWDDEPHEDPYDDPYELSCYDELDTVGMDEYDLSYYNREHDRTILRDMLKRRSATSIINLVHDIQVEKQMQRQADNALYAAAKRRGFTIVEMSLARMDPSDIQGMPVIREEYRVHGTATGRFDLPD